MLYFSTDGCINKSPYLLTYLLTYEEQSILEIAITTYRAANGNAPAYLSSYFTRVTDVPSRQRLRSTYTNQLAVPPFTLSSVGKQASPVSGATYWNSLPPYVTSAPSLAIFRQRLKTFLFHLSYPDLVI